MMRVLAIGDIHGCLGAFDALLKWVEPTPDDLVVTLGDYVDRGPDSRGVIDRLLELRQRLNLVCLRGNHEVMMLEAYRAGYSEKKMWLSVGGKAALSSYGITPDTSADLDLVPREHWDFLRNGLVNYHESELFIFVHATVYPDLPMDEQPDNVLHWEFLPDAMRHCSGKTVICGHSSQKNGKVKVIPGAVCIDTFAHGGRWLTCLDAISGRWWQADMHGNRREGRVNYDDDFGDPGD